MPENSKIDEVTASAQLTKKRLKQELFLDEYTGVEDVNKACLPDGNSLIAPNGDFILYRFTGSGMYNNLRHTLHSILETASQCPVNTPEKATLEWMTKIFEWVESIQNSLYYSNEKLVMKIDHALEILEQGHQIFYTVADEVQLYLREEKVGIHVFPQQFHVSELRGGQYTLGIGLLRWSTLLFECLNSDVDREDLWKERSLGAINTFTTFDQQSRAVGGGAISFRNATVFRDTVKSLITESSNLIIQDDELICSLSSLPQRMQNNALFRRSIEVERIAMKEKKFLEEKDRFENPRRIVDDRYELLDSLMHKLPPSYETDDLHKMIGEYDDNSLFPGEQTARDKSRFFLEKSLWSGVETLGLDPNGNIKDFVSIFAWNLEEAVHAMYHTDHLEPISSEYRDKIRSLRFNLQDPKVRI